MRLSVELPGKKRMHCSKEELKVSTCMQGGRVFFEVGRSQSYEIIYENISMTQAKEGANIFFSLIIKQLT